MALWLASPLQTSDTINDDCFASCKLAFRYLIEAESSEGKPDVRLGINKHSRQSVILKFYPTRQLFEKSLEFTQMLCPSHVSKSVAVDRNVF